MENDSKDQSQPQIEYRSSRSETREWSSNDTDSPHEILRNMSNFTSQRLHDGKQIQSQSQSQQWSSDSINPLKAPEWSSHEGGLQDFSSGQWSSQQESSIQGDTHLHSLHQKMQSGGQDLYRQSFGNGWQTNLHQESSTQQNGSQRKDEFETSFGADDWVGGSHGGITSTDSHSGDGREADKSPNDSHKHSGLNDSKQEGSHQESTDKSFEGKKEDDSRKEESGQGLQHIYPYLEASNPGASERSGTNETSNHGSKHESNTNGSSKHTAHGSEKDQESSENGESLENSKQNGPRETASVKDTSGDIKDQKDGDKTTLNGQHSSTEDKSDQHSHVQEQPPSSRDKGSPSHNAAQKASSTKDDSQQKSSVRNGQGGAVESSSSQEHKSISKPDQPGSDEASDKDSPAQDEPKQEASEQKSSTEGEESQKVNQSVSAENETSQEDSQNSTPFPPATRDTQSPVTNDDQPESRADETIEHEQDTSSNPVSSSPTPAPPSEQTQSTDLDEDVNAPENDTISSQPFSTPDQPISLQDQSGNLSGLQEEPEIQTTTAPTMNSPLRNEVTRSTGDTYRSESPSTSERAPLLDHEEIEEPKTRSPPALTKQPEQSEMPSRTSMMDRSRSPSPATERTPLIARDEETNGDINEPMKKPRRKATYIALAILCVAVVIALVAGFAIPAVVQEYAKQAITFEPGTMSIESFTDAGVQARVQGVFYLDANKVRSSSTRNLGRAATYIAREIESDGAEVMVYLPEYDNILLGNATMPPIVLNIRNSHHNIIDMLVDVRPGEIAGIRSVAQDFIHGKETLDVSAIAVVPVKSGIFNLGTQRVKQFVRVERGNKTNPDFDIESVKIAEYGTPGSPHGIKARAKVAAKNPYKVKFDVPSINMDILLPDCDDDYLQLGTMRTDVVHVKPGTIHAGATAFMSQLPADLTKTCPNSTKSPFDHLVSAYLEGGKPKVFVRGGEQDEGTPVWIGEILKTVVQAPVPPPHHMGNMVKNFSLSNVHFSLPATPEGSPVLSAIVQVIVNLPPDLDLKVGVNRVRADSDVYFEGERMGKLDLREWQPSNSTKHGDELRVQSIVTNAPLEVTNQTVFTKVVQSMIFGGKGVSLGIKAQVDVETVTALGDFIIRKIPSEGKIFIKPLSPGGFNQKVERIEVVGSSPEELIMEAHVKVINPTDYSADIPFVNVSLWHNETRLGFAWGGFSVRPGENAVSMKASWFKGKVPAELLSQYISGWNTSMTISNPVMPGLPTPDLNITVPMPHMFGKFLKDTTMHVLSSTATFVLFSPIPMWVTSIKSHAFHNGTDIGTIDYDQSFAVDVGDTMTPRMPVDWNTNGGFGLIREALGGSLKLDARAETGVRIGEWEETLWYEAKGLGAKVRF